MSALKTWSADQQVALLFVILFGCCCWPAPRWRC
jgi:hypothetical protein